MSTTEKSIEVLNDLIEINCDRVAVFSEGKKELDENDNDLKIVFELLRDESRENVYELCLAIKRNGFKANAIIDNVGDLQRAWQDVKPNFTAHNREITLKEFARSEKTIQNVYQRALSLTETLSPDLNEILSRQQQDIIEAHNIIRDLNFGQVS